MRKIRQYSGNSYFQHPDIFHIRFFPDFRLPYIALSYSGFSDELQKAPEKKQECCVVLKFKFGKTFFPFHIPLTHQEAW